jgi:hypothetical protein
MNNENRSSNGATCPEAVGAHEVCIHIFDHFGGDVLQGATSQMKWGKDGGAVS